VTETLSDQPVGAHAADLAALMGMSGAVVKRVVWGGFAVLLAAFCVRWLLPKGSNEAVILGQVLWMVIAAIAAAMAYIAHRSTTGAESRFWEYLTIAGVCILAGQVYEVVYLTLISAQGPPGVSVTSLLDIAAALVFLSLLGVFARFRHASVAARVRYIVDLAAVCLVAISMLAMWVVVPWFTSHGPATIGVRLLYAASPVAGLLLLGGTVRILLGTRIDRLESWEKLLGASVVAFAVGLVLAPVGYADATWHVALGWARAGLDIVWLSAIYLAMAGAVYRRLSRKRPWRLRPLAVMEPSYGWWPAVVLPAIEVLAIPFLGVAAIQSPDAVAYTSRLAGLGMLAVLLGLRTLLTVADIDTLIAGAAVDPLTGLHSHRHFQEQLASEIASAVRYHESLSLIMLDLDDFARVNAVGGHAGGDQALVEVARAVERAVRVRDVVCRLGGDEVAVILPGADANAAFAIALRALSEVRAVIGPAGRSLSASAGVASYPLQASDREQLMKRAEGARYWAKTHGKDRVTVYDPNVVVALDADDQIRELRQRADLEAVRALAAAVDARDASTQDHSRNVARHAVSLARDLGLDDQTVLLVEFAGLLHDVGKIGVPDSILHKAGPMTAAERATMERHPELGEEILSSTSMREILPWVRHHHERWDGAGYPDHLAAEDIPLGARIVAIANAYDAMRSDRPRRAALSRSAALQEIDLGLGSQFDPVLGERFIGVVGRRYV
jgi:diguanylate cyclase (GGDEF)-like protein/putative nucleotidyltransferase with HDIG domain